MPASGLHESEPTFPPKLADRLGRDAAQPSAGRVVVMQIEVLAVRHRSNPPGAGRTGNGSAAFASPAAAPAALRLPASRDSLSSHDHASRGHPVSSAKATTRRTLAASSAAVVRPRILCRSIRTNREA